MNHYEDTFLEEKRYLKAVTDFLEEQLDLLENVSTEQKNYLRELKKEIWNECSKDGESFDDLVEVTQYNIRELIATSQHNHTQANFNKYLRSLEKPYFARFDFAEGNEDTETFYIGHTTIMDDDTYQVMAYDWRSPIASIFYRHELGPASYAAPCGDIAGEVSLKRQYSINRGQLNDFFDCTIAITDELLQQTLCQNTSTKMKNIVETIQRDQDQIIRNNENDVLIVQGVAGSGKTSIAMHRIAFLLYDRLKDGLTHDNIAIVSPNHLFSEYISNVLPELGEHNVVHLTLDDLFEKCFGQRYIMYSRMDQLEQIMLDDHSAFTRECIDFKGSILFTTLLDRLIHHLEIKCLKFEDIYYNGQVIISKYLIRNHFLNNKINMPITKRLNRLELMINERIDRLTDERYKKVQFLLEQKGGYEFEEVKLSKKLVAKQKIAASRHLSNVLDIDLFDLYTSFIKNDYLFNKLSKGLTLPSNIDQIRQATLQKLDPHNLPYEDAIALLYLKLKLDGKKPYPNLKQVVIDEAQDYYAIHYQIFAQIFKECRYTILGDICQTIERKGNKDFYPQILNLVNAKKGLQIDLTKSYRSSYEINTFNNQLREDPTATLAIQRHGEKPYLHQCQGTTDLNNQILRQLNTYIKNGFETIVILCKTATQCSQAYATLSKHISLKLITVNDTFIEKGIFIMPIYMSKGLEFDGVIVYDSNAQDYNTPFDKQLLYIAGTRALHRLSFYAIGQLSPYLLEHCF